MKALKYICLLILTITVVRLSAQQYQFVQYNSEEGLTANDVVKIIQDSRGHIWLATMGGGIYRFNGTKFENFRETDGLGDNNSGSLLELPDGRLMILCLKCISIYDGKQFKNYTEKDGLNLPGQWGSTAIDKQGRAWIVIWNADGSRQLMYFKNDKFTDITLSNTFLNESATKLSSVVNDCNGDIIVNANGNLFQIKDTLLVESSLHNEPALKGKRLNLIYCSTSKKMYFLTYDRELAKLRYFSYLNGEIHYLELDNEINYWFLSGVCEDNFRNVWIPSQSGVYRINEKDEVIYINENNGLPIGNVFWVINDNQNNIWFATRGQGILKFVGDKFISYDEKDGLESKKIYNNFIASNSDIWYTSSLGSAYCFNGLNFIKSEIEDNKETYGFFETQDNRIIALTNEGLFDVNSKQNKQLNSIFGLENDEIPRVVFNDGKNIWFVTFKNILVKFDGHSSFRFSSEDFGRETGTLDYITSDTSGNTWIATNSGYLKFNGEKFSFNKYPDNCISPDDIKLDKWNRVWIAVYGGLIQISNDKVTLFNKKSGMSSDFYNSLGIDKSGSLYAGFNQGFDIIRFASNGNIASITLISPNDGFCGSVLGGQNINSDNAGNLWFATMDGLIKVNPEKLVSNNKPPTTYVSNVKLFYKNVNWNSEPYSKFCDSVSSWNKLPVNLKLPYEKNHLTLEFEGICFDNPEGVRYQWKLEGLDKDWSPISDETKAEYPNLLPGKYVFMVRSCNSNGVWIEKPVEFAFIIEPPYWQTWWFISLMLLLIISVPVIIIVLILYMKYRQKVAELNKLKEIEKIRNSLSKDIHDGAGASLSKIALLSESLKKEIDNNEVSLKKLNQISGLSRSVIDDFREIIWSTNAKYDNVASLMAYSRNYCNDLFDETNIECSIKFSDDNSEFYISPLKRQTVFLVFKEALHNILKHSSATKCEVEIYVSQNEIYLVVSDNGLGFDFDKTSVFSHGLINMNKRAASCNGQLKILSSPGNGTKISLNIPL